MLAFLARSIDGLSRLLTAKRIAVVAIALSVTTAAVLALSHVTLTGPGDHLRYYEQAADLFPFRDHYYGPMYFIALRFFHEIGFGWYEAGKLIGFLSGCAFIALSHLLFRRVLEERLAWFATALVAVNAQVMAESFTGTTILFGAVWVAIAVLLIAQQPVERMRPWVLGGLMFGVAALSRTQAIGFLLGAIGMTVFLSGAWRHRIRSASLLIVGAVIPLMAWRFLLMAVQGDVPVNYSFVHLTYPLGEFTTFHVEDDLIAKYGSTWGVLSADPMNLPRILIFGVSRLLHIPSDQGLELLGPPGFFIFPGALVALSRRESYAPWIGALAAGLFLTGLASRGWLLYYPPTVPLLVYLVVIGADTLVRGRDVVLSRVTWTAIFGSALLWGVVQTTSIFRSDNWPEWRPMREYVNAHTDSTSLVTSTARSLEYGGTFRWIDFDDIMQGKDTAFVEALRARGVTHMVIEERHMVPQYPSMRPLLDDVPARVPAGLVRDTLIVNPKRVALYRIQP
jgi:hypothetical protein